MKPRETKAGATRWFSIILLFAVTSGVIFSATDFGKDLDGLCFDKFAPLLGTPREVHDPLVILIGEADYSAAKTPLALWGNHLVPLLKKIAQGKPEAMGLDLILPQFPLNRIDRDHDKKVFKTLNGIRKHCRLVSGYGIGRKGRIKEPFVLYQRILGPNGYGFLNVTPDSDGVCRQQVLSLPSNKEDQKLYSFSWRLSGKKGPPPAEAMPDWRNPARIPTLTFQQALKTDPAAFTDRVVIIGIDFDFEDRHPTPTSVKDEAAMIGVTVVCSARVFQGYWTVKDTFGRYVSREVRDKILSGRIPLDGEMREVTMLFADLRGFTPMVEARPPKEVVKIMNRYFVEMSAAIREQKGLVLQYIGDEIEAVFGAPVPVPDHRRRAVRAAISMRSRLKIVNRNLARQGYAPLKHGIGIHTGSVLAGNIGGGDRVTYSLVGDTVNLASRLQGLNKQFGTDIIISARTLAGIDKSIPVKQLPPVPIRGKTKKIDICAVI